MAIKTNQTLYDVEQDNPLVSSLYNYGYNSTTSRPVTDPRYMITEITEDQMITESGDNMITEF